MFIGPVTQGSSQTRDPGLCDSIPLGLPTCSPRPTSGSAAGHGHGRTPTNPKGIVASSPRLRATSYLGSQFANKFNRNAVVAKSRDGDNSIPDIFLGPFDLVLAQQCAQ